MSGLKLANNASSILASQINISSTTLSLQTGGGALFPTLNSGEWFPVVVVDPAGNREIMRCTARSGDTLTVVRAQEGTAARAFNPGARVDLRLTAGAINDILGSLASDLDSAVADLSSKLSARTGARLLAPQATAETGWQQVTSINDRVLRVVSGAGGGMGGSWVISGLTVQGHTLTTGEIPPHSHTGVTDAQGGHQHAYNSPDNKIPKPSGSGTEVVKDIVNNNTGFAGTHTHNVSTNNTGGGAAHDHPLSANGNWRPAYLDCIVVEKIAA